MAINSASSFKKMLDDDEKNGGELKYRAQTIAAGYLNACAERGIKNVTIEDLYSLSAVQLHILLNEPVQEGIDWITEGEQKGIAGFQTAKDNRELMEALGDESDAAKKLAAEEKLAKAMSELSPAERMRRAREMGQSFPGRKTGEGEKNELDASAKAAEIKKLESAPAWLKMKRARELGL